MRILNDRIRPDIGFDLAAVDDEVNNPVDDDKVAFSFFNPVK